jgi:hypothetical protein
VNPWLWLPIGLAAWAAVAAVVALALGRVFKLGRRAAPRPPRKGRQR